MEVSYIAAADKPLMFFCQRRKIHHPGQAPAAITTTAKPDSSNFRIIYGSLQILGPVSVRTCKAIPRIIYMVSYPYPEPPSSEILSRSFDIGSIHYACRRYYGNQISGSQTLC